MSFAVLRTEFVRILFSYDMSIARQIEDNPNDKLDDLFEVLLKWEKFWEASVETVNER